MRGEYGTPKSRRSSRSVPLADEPARELTLQEWMGHRDIATTQRYADYSPSPHEAAMVASAFAKGFVRGSNLSESHLTSHDLSGSTAPDRS